MTEQQIDPTRRQEMQPVDPTDEEKAEYKLTAEMAGRDDEQKNSGKGLENQTTQTKVSQMAMDAQLRTREIMSEEKLGKEEAQKKATLELKAAVDAARETGEWATVKDSIRESVETLLAVHEENEDDDDLGLGDYI